MRLASKTTVQGQTIIELLVALALISVVVVSLISLSIWSVKNSNFSRNKTMASRFIQETLEWLRNERNKSWNNFYTYAQTHTWCFISLNWSTAKTVACSENDKVSGTVFRRQVEFTVNSEEEVTVLVSLKWNDIEGVHSSRSTTVLTKWGE